jgi:hypothetical protein
MNLGKPQENNSNRPILVTGGHRSGTTWVGKMLAAGDQVAYISEPLNVWHRPGVLRAQVSKWYTYICDDNQDDYLPAFREMLAYQYHSWAELRSLRSTKDLLRMLRDLSTFTNARMRVQRPLLKDPFAVFSVPWFIDRLGCQVVVTVRHPVAIASSLKRLNWNFDFHDLLDQPLLMRDWLESYRPEMETLSADDVIGQASLLWKIIYHTVDQYRKTDFAIQIVRHEDLSQAPSRGYQELYESLGLAFTPKAQKTIRCSTSPENPKQVSRGRVHAIKLDTRANLDNWRHRLGAEEITRIRRLTEEEASLYYPNFEWNYRGH